MKKRDTGIRFILILLITVAFTVSSGCVKDFDEQSNYEITNIEMSAESVKSSYVDLNTTAYIENWGADSRGNITLQLKAFSEQTGLLELSRESKVEYIKKGDTTAVSQSVRLPKAGSYRLIFDLYEDEQKKASSTVTIRNLEDMPTDLQETGIQIEGIDFIAREATSKRVVIENDIYLKNEGAETSEDYRILVKAREMDARLIADKEWISSGEIKPEETIIRSVNLTVPDNYNYIVEVSIWKGNTVVKTGEDYVQLNPEKIIDRDKLVQNKNINTADFVVEGGLEPSEETADYETSAGTASPGFTAPFAALSLIAALYIARRRL